MKAGRPKGSARVKTRKQYHTAGRYSERRERLLRKKQKLEMIECLIGWWEDQPHRDVDYIQSLTKRADELRSQLAVYSTYG
jgi:hypothetical protein